MKAAIGAALGTRVTATRPLGGGDINEAWEATLAGGRTVFVKSNARAPAGMFAAEAKGLAWLADAGAIRIPKVLAIGDDFLVLEMIHAAAKRNGFDEELGRALAALHRFERVVDLWQIDAPCDHALEVELASQRNLPHGVARRDHAGGAPDGRAHARLHHLDDAGARGRQELRRGLRVQLSCSSKRDASDRE